MIFEEIALATSVLVQVTLLILLGMDYQQDQETTPYLPKRGRPPKSNWIKSFAKHADNIANWLALHLKITRKRRRRTSSPLGYKSPTIHKNLHFRVLHCCTTNALSSSKSSHSTKMFF
jgi:hypothetical protein